MTTVRRHAVITGRVQGVGFRWSAVRQAEELGLAGWVRNLPDGRVEAEFEGNPAAVEHFSRWLTVGPSFARVEDVEVTEHPTTGEAGFRIR